MSNSIHEKRVKSLLDSWLAYVFKPADGRHAGAVKLDFLGCDHDGTFWAVEVKATGNQHWYTPNAQGARGLSPLQRRALDQIVDGSERRAAVYVAVGKEKELYLFPWAAWRDKDRWPLEEAPYHLTFTTWADWRNMEIA
jgi:hypothetical protein